MTMIDDHKIFLNAMSRFASGVTIVTTVDTEGRPRGFTASAFASLSQQPPMVLVCLSLTAECFLAFVKSDSFTVSILKPEHADLARLFATRGADKFGAGGFRWSQAHPAVDGALAVVHCGKASVINGGDHVILTGIVQSAEVSDGTPTVYFDRAFHAIT